MSPIVSRFPAALEVLTDCIQMTNYLETTTTLWYELYPGESVLVFQRVQGRNSQKTGKEVLVLCTSTEGLALTELLPR